MQHKVVGREQLLQRLHGVVLTRLQDVVGVDCLASGGCQAFRAHGAEVDNDRNGIRRTISSRSARAEAVRRRSGIVMQQMTREIVICRVRLQTLDGHVVVVSQRCWVGNRDIGRGSIAQVVRRTTVVNNRFGELLKGVPGHSHASVGCIRDADLRIDRVVRHRLCFLEQPG